MHRLAHIENIMPLSFGFMTFFAHIISALLVLDMATKTTLTLVNLTPILLSPLLYIAFLTVTSVMNIHDTKEVLEKKITATEQDFQILTDVAALAYGNEGVEEQRSALKKIHLICIRRALSVAAQRQLSLEEAKPLLELPSEVIRETVAEKIEDVCKNDGYKHFRTELLVKAGLS